MSGSLERSGTVFDTGLHIGSTTKESPETIVGESTGSFQKPPSRMIRVGRSAPQGYVKLTFFLSLHQHFAP